RRDAVQPARQPAARDRADGRMGPHAPEGAAGRHVERRRAAAGAGHRPDPAGHGRRRRALRGGTARRGVAARDADPGPEARRRRRREAAVTTTEETNALPGLTDVATGGRLWIESRGEGPPVVLLHSGLVDSRMFDSQMDSLANG